MWTPTTRAQHSRANLRYGSDLTDAEWAILEPFLPTPCSRGRKRRWPMRSIIEAIFYVLRSGCAWEMLPDSFPPPSTVYRWFAPLRDDGTWETVNHHLVMRDRERAEREASPTVGVMTVRASKPPKQAVRECMMRARRSKAASGTLLEATEQAIRSSRRASLRSLTARRSSQNFLLRSARRCLYDVLLDASCDGHTSPSASVGRCLNQDSENPMQNTVADKPASSRSIVFFMDDAFILRQNGSHARAVELLQWLTGMYQDVSVYSYIDHSWTEEARILFQHQFPHVPLYLEKSPRLIRAFGQLKKISLALSPAIGHYLADLSLPGFTPRLTALRHEKPGALWILILVDALTWLNGAPDRFIVDTHDVKFLKWSKTAGRKPYSLRALTLMRAEFAVIERSLAAVAITDGDKYMLEQFIDRRTIFHVLSYKERDVSIQAITHEPPWQFDLLFVGANNHFNVSGLCRFLAGNADWLPAYRVSVCGRVCENEEVRALADKTAGVTLLGFVNDISQIYKASRAVIAPIDGTGLKIKVVEALAHGKPIFASPHARDGLVPGYERCVKPIERTIIEKMLGDDEELLCMHLAAVHYYQQFIASGDLRALRDFIQTHVQAG